VSADRTVWSPDIRQSRSGPGDPLRCRVRFDGGAGDDSFIRRNDRLRAIADYFFVSWNDWICAAVNVFSLTAFAWERTSSGTSLRASSAELAVTIR
jgi:hypothetical protein